MKKRSVLLAGLLAVSLFMTSLGGCGLLDDEDYEEVEMEDRAYDADEDAEAESGDEENKAPGLASKLKKAVDEKAAEVEPMAAGASGSATIMIYMNGSDLESDSGEGSIDISEMLDSGIGENVNVIIQTMGTYEWQDHGISADTTQIHQVKNGQLVLVQDNMGQLDCTSEQTFSDFLEFGKTNYPADRYILIFWDHGGGPVYGFGYDQWQSEDASLTLDEMVHAFASHPDLKFDLIGMDCCIMANMETCMAFQPYCKYTVLSEDFESGLGWAYTEWMRDLEKNPGMSTPLLGKKIIDTMVNANETEQYGASSTMVLVDETKTDDLFTAWKDFAYENEDALLGSNYSKLYQAKGRGFLDLVTGWADDGSNVTLSDYYISDMLATVESIGAQGEKTEALRTALKACTVYYGHTSDKNELTGISVSLPYGDSYFYNQLQQVYRNLDCIDDEYIDWLQNFVGTSAAEDYADYSGFEQSFGGWSDYEQGWGCYTGACETGGGEEEEYYYEDTGDWVYDYEDELWYLYEDGFLYLYDDETDTMYYYDEDYDTIYYYDEAADDWFEAE